MIDLSTKGGHRILLASDRNTETKCTLVITQRTTFWGPNNTTRTSEKWAASLRRMWYPVLHKQPTRSRVYAWNLSIWHPGNTAVNMYHAWVDCETAGLLPVDAYTVWVGKTIIVTELEDTNMWCNIPHSLETTPSAYNYCTAYYSGYGSCCQQLYIDLQVHKHLHDWGPRITYIRFVASTIV